MFLAVACAFPQPKGVRNTVLFTLVICAWGSAQVASACTCPQRPQIVGDGGGMPANARALFFWTPDVFQQYETEVQVKSADGVRACPSRTEAVGPEALNTLHLSCPLQEGDELEVTFALKGKVVSRSRLDVNASAPLPSNWARLDERPAHHFETETDTGVRCSAKSQVFGLQVPIRWSAQALAWKDITVLSASIGRTPYRRPLSNTCDRGFDTLERASLEVFSRDQGFNKVVRKKVGLNVFVPGEGVKKAASLALNVPAEFEHRPIPSYAAAQNGKLADNLSGIDTRRGLAQVYANVESCGPGASASVELEIAGASGEVVNVRVHEARDPAQATCIEKAAQGIRFGRFKQSRDTIRLQLM